jgi:RND superfamily putative drug exporter
MTLIPALMSLLGERAWWLPRWLDRLLPDVDIEGANLERHEGGDGGSGADADAGDDGRGAADEDPRTEAGRVATGRASA